MSMEKKRIKLVLAMSKIKREQAFKNKNVYGVISFKK